MGPLKQLRVSENKLRRLLNFEERAFRNNGVALVTKCPKGQEKPNRVKAFGFFLFVEAH
jgi:hypothetical protein